MLPIIIEPTDKSTISAMKRFLDVILSSVGLVLIFPVLLTIAVWVKLSSSGAVFYRGTRAGRFGRPFRIFKFRTMVVNADKLGGPSTSADDPRITAAGRLLRHYKLDELPQLLNVLKGDMSLVGPRPEVMAEVALYNAQEKHLLDVRPGITDWASLKFRDEGEILRGSADPHQAYRELIRPEKVRLGLEYVKCHSVVIDCKILLWTVRTLVG